MQLLVSECPIILKISISKLKFKILTNSKKRNVFFLSSDIFSPIFFFYLSKMIYCNPK